MQNEFNLDEYSATAKSEVEGSKEPGFMNPELLNIRAVIDTDNAARSVWPAEKILGNCDRRRLQKMPKVQCLLERAASFFKRPDAPRLLAILLLIVIVYEEPGFVFFFFMMSLLTGFVLFFSFGPDRVQNWIVKRYKRLRDRDPDAAERMRQRAARTSKQLSEIVDRLPKKWTTGLYLPDFEEPAEVPEKWKTDPFERLVRQ